MAKKQPFFSLAILSLVVLIGFSATAYAQNFSGWISKNPFNFFKKNNDPDEIKEPRRIVSLWSDTVLHQSGRQSTRGIAGRIYFYDVKHQAIKVEGELVVYAFDDNNGLPENRPADHKYIFTREQLPTHFSMSDFGASYSIWLPWDAVGGQQTKLSLVAVFRGKKNNLIVGQMAQHVLPGTTQGVVVDRMPPPQATTGGVRPASYGEANNAEVAPPSPFAEQPAPQDNVTTQPGLRTTTITLPPSTQRRISTPWQTTPRNRSIPGRETVATNKPRPWANLPTAMQSPSTVNHFGQTSRGPSQKGQSLSQPHGSTNQHLKAPVNPSPPVAMEQPSGRFVRPRFLPQATQVAEPTPDLPPSERRRSEPQFDPPPSLQLHQTDDPLAPGKNAGRAGR